MCQHTAAFGAYEFVHCARRAGSWPAGSGSLQTTGSSPAWPSPIPSGAGISAPEQIILPGHVGTVYQASNAAYLGRTSPSTRVLLPDGTVLDNRSMQKVRTQERGAGGVERRLTALGAPGRSTSEDPRRWLANALRHVHAHRFRHPGVHRYVLTTPRARRAQTGLYTLATQPYPHHTDAAA